MLSTMPKAACLVAVSIILALMWAAPSRAVADPPALENYGRLPRTEDVELSPDGTMLAVIATEQDRRQLVIKRTDGGVLVSADMGDLKLAGLSWVGDDYVIIYSHRTTRLAITSRFEEEFIQGIVIDVKTGRPRPLLHDSAEYLAAIFGNYGYVQENGQWVGYFGIIPTTPSMDTSRPEGFFKQRYPDLYRVNVETGEVRRVTTGTVKSRSWAVDSTGKIVAEADSDSNSGNWRVFLPGSPGEPLASGNSPFGFSLSGLGRRPGTVLVRLGGNTGEILELDLATGHMESLLPAGKSLTMIHARDTRLLLGAVLLDENRMVMFDPVLGRHIQSIEKAFSGDALRLASVSGDLSRIVVHVAGKKTAGTWQLIDFKNGKADPIADDFPEIPDAMIGPVTLVDYKAADGLALQGVLTLPPELQAEGLPLIVLPHGGPEARDRVHFDWWAQALASRGYAVFQPNFRGSSGYGMEFRNAGYGQWGRKMQTDLSDGVAALAAKGVIDPHRVCIVGASYGGYAALAGVTLQHGIYRCAASYGGVTDMHDLMFNAKAHDRGDTQRYSDPAMRFWLSYLGIDSPSDPMLDSISPQAQAKQADAPVLLIYGEHDTVVPTRQSTDMASALKDAGKSVELVELEGEDHWLSRSETRLQMLKAVVAFVEKYNPPATH